MATRIGGPGPSVPSGPTEEARGTDRATGSGKTFAATVEATTGPAATAPTDRPAPPPFEGKLTGDLGRRLENKEITVEAALNEVVSLIVDQQLPGAPPRTRSQIEGALRDAIESDPGLSAKIRNLND